MEKKNDEKWNEKNHCPTTRTANDVMSGLVNWSWIYSPRDLGNGCIMNDLASRAELDELQPGAGKRVMML